MNKIVVIYESKYGYTRRYAQWIAKELSCPAFERKKFRPRNFSQYDTIIYGGGLYAGGLSGIRLLTHNQAALSDRQIILFTCGLADPDNPKNTADIRTSLSKALPKELYEQIRFFHLQGGIDYSRLSFVHRAMMSMMCKMLRKKGEDNLSHEDRQVLATYGKKIDFTRYESIRPLVEYAASRKPSKLQDR